MKSTGPLVTTPGLRLFSVALGPRVVAAMVEEESEARADQLTFPSITGGLTPGQPP